MDLLQIFLLFLTATHSLDEGKPYSCYCSICANGSECPTSAGCYISVMVGNDMQLLTEMRGCLYSTSGTMNHATCENSNTRLNEYFYCCFTKDCNSPQSAKWTVAIPEDKKDGYSPGDEMTKLDRNFTSPVWIPALFCIIAIVLFVCWVALSVFLFSPDTRKRVMEGYFKFKENLTGNSHCNTTPLILYDPSNEIISPSNSGTGEAWIEQPSISKQIKMEKLIATGRYAHVMLGVWNYQDVAVKILFPSENEMGNHEARIYHQYHLRHENLLCFIASDCNDRENWLQTWLIFDYHPCGSLYDYLENTHPTVTGMLKILSSITAGLLYLHTEIVGNMGRKPSIAHRDVKTKNVLMKYDGTCCISDLGISIASDIFDQSKDREMSSDEELSESVEQVIRNLSSGGSFMNELIGKKLTGTKRFLPPEMLTQPISVPSFEYFLKVDIYSLGLLFWEVAYCTLNDDCLLQDYVHKHKIAYEDIVNPDPSTQDMFDVVVTRSIRPELPKCWEQIGMFKDLGSLMSECWYHTPESRPRIVAVKLLLAKIANQSTAPQNS